MAKNIFNILWVLLFCSITIFGQKSVDKSLSAKNSNCKILLNGNLLNSPKPIYPIEAKTAGISGKVEVVVEIDETGNVIGIESANGNELLTKSASEAAKDAKFSPTTCDGQATKTIGVINFTFPSVNLVSEFFKPAKIEDFSDINEENSYYEAILFLADNYQIAFGYADRKYHSEMPLRKADFAHFLYQTLVMLDSKTEFAKKLPEELKLYQAYNPHNLQEIEFNPTAPEADSIKILSEKYGIILADENGIFESDELFSQSEVIEIWQNIFGEESIPVNFSKTSESEMTRGEFSLFLKESLDFLTYKVLP